LGIQVEEEPPIGRILAITTIVVAVSITAVALARSVGMTPDGAVYQSVAQHLAIGQGYTDYTGSSVSVFPPGVPILLAFLIWVGASPHTAWVLVNVGALATYLLATWALLRLVVASMWVRLSLLAVVAFVVAGTGVFTAALSDPLFAALAAVFVLVTARLVDRPSDRTGPWFALAGSVAALSFVAKYSGAFYVAAIIGLVVVLTRRARLVIVTALVALGVPTIVLAWNQAATGSLMGQRLPSAISPVANAKDAAVTLARFFALWPAPKMLEAVGFIAFVVAVLVLRSRPVRHRSVAIWLGVLAAGFPIFMVISASTAPLNSLDSRLLLPALLPFVALVGCVIDPWAERVTSQVALRQIGIVAGVGAVSIAGGVGLLLSVQHATQDDMTVWNDPKISQALAEIKPSSRIHSNAPDVVWFYTDRDAYWTPSETAYQSTYRPKELPAFLEYMKCAGPVSIVWLYHPPDSGLYSIQSIVPGAIAHDPITVIVKNARGASSKSCVNPRSFGQGTGLRS
jgi:hypothetical protein